MEHRTLGDVACTTTQFDEEWTPDQLDRLSRAEETLRGLTDRAARIVALVERQRPDLARTLAAERAATGHVLTVLGGADGTKQALCACGWSSTGHVESDGAAAAFAGHAFLAPALTL